VEGSDSRSLANGWTRDNHQESAKARRAHQAGFGGVADRPRIAEIEKPIPEELETSFQRGDFWPIENIKAIMGEVQFPSY